MAKLDENLVREISSVRNEPEWLLLWRLDALRAWIKMPEPHWADFEYDPIDYDALNYYNAPSEIDNSDLEHVYDKMGLPESEKRALLGMATDTVIDSKSVHTSYTAELEKLGIIFLPISEAVQRYPDLVRENLGTVVPAADNFFAALNAAVFSDGTFVYIPRGVKCPIDLASYFRIETAKIGQFERTLIIADDSAELSYMEGCSAPRRPAHQLHSGVVEIVARKNSHVRYATVQNWYAGEYKDGKNIGGILNFVTKRGRADENAEILWTQVEIGSARTWKYPSTILAGRGAHSDFYSLSITRGAQTADTGTKMIHAADNTVSNIVSYGVAMDASRQTFRSLVSFSGRGGKNASKCDTRLIGKNAVANTLPTIIHANGENIQSHEATTGAIDAATLTYLEMAGLTEDTATALIIGATAAPVISRLPMEFLVESKQLIQMAIGGK
ncbi:Fe-S cluster assembly protein SufB [bacterium]|nr:Fe-S cluster assembly protein SufB [bacterium]